MHRFSSNVVLVLLIYTNLPFISGNNDTKESILEKPPAAGTSRLPSSLQNFVINSTNLEEEATIVDKKISQNVKEVREPPEFEEPPRKKPSIQSTNSSFEPSAKSSNENYITIGNHKFKSNGNYESGFTPFVPSPQFSEETISAPFYQDGDAAFKTTDHFKASAVVKHEHFYSPTSSSGYDGAIRNNYINLPYSKFHHEKLPYVTTFAPPKINPMQRPNLYYDYHKDKKYPYIHPAPVEEYGKNSDFTSPEFQHNKFPADFHGHNDFLANGAPVDDGFFHHYPKPIYSGKPYHKSHGLWQILATLLPIGLFLTALQPKVIFINSTNPQAPNGVKPFFRLADDNFQSTDANVVLYNLVANAGLTPSNDVTCNKMKICQAAAAGSGSSEQSNFAEYSLWYLVSRSTSSIRKKLHLEDVFEAVQTRQCEQFSCLEETTTTQKNQT
ncbi:uncharacterized protein LOC135840041 [Planococcus citri]|uniref:uncharacterized protein LOC135840041 n=1 Tax=Planococcus citri TaxID=170843 RepID=UPI0031FA1845